MARPEYSNNADEFVRILSASMNEELVRWANPPDAEEFTIFTVPSNIHENKKNLLEPSVITIGPLNHGDRRFSTMENIKWQSLHNFLSQDSGRKLDAYIQHMKGLEERTRHCYGEVTDKISSPDFVKMMVVDGCFVLSYFSDLLEGRRHCSFQLAGWHFAFIYTDLLLLENQLPYFVIEELGKISGVGDMKMALPASFANYFKQKHNENIRLPDRIHHLSHLYYLSIVHTTQELGESDTRSSVHDSDLRSSVCHGFKDTIKCIFVAFPVRAAKRILCCANMSTKENSKMVIPCVTELKEAGVQFRYKATENSEHMLDISFVNGVLEIPRIEIGDEFKPLFMNLLAFEQCNLSKLELQPRMASYARFLDSLINTQEDVMILQKSGIIENLLSSEEELTTFFNQVSGDIVLGREHPFAELFEEVNVYCESSWNRQLAKVKRYYFSSPWKAIALFTAVVLLILTVVQTTFAIKSYH